MKKFNFVKLAKSIFPTFSKVKYNNNLYSFKKRKTKLCSVVRSVDKNIEKTLAKYK